MTALKTVLKRIPESILVIQLVVMPLLVPLAFVRAEDADPAYPSDPGGLNEFSSPSDPGGLDEFGSGGGISSGSGSGFGLGSLGGILSSSGVSCGGSGGTGGFLGSIFGGALGKVGNIFGGFLGGGSGGGSTGANADSGADALMGGTTDMGSIGGGSTGANADSGADALMGGTTDMGSIGGGGSGSALGGLMGGGGKQFVPVSDDVVRNETGRIRTNTGEIVKKECVLDPIAKAITAVLLKTLGSRILSWIQNSDVGFIKNYEMEFRKVERERGTQFLSNLSTTHLGGNTNAYTNYVLGQPTPAAGGFQKTFDCPVPQLRDGSFYENFNNGGWPVFTQMMSNAACNTEGGLLLATEWQHIEVENAKEGFAAETAANSGNRGYKVETKERCEPIPDDAGAGIPAGPGGGMRCFPEKETRTPGESIKDLMNRIFGSGIDWVINADEVNEAITASIMFLADTLVKTSSGPDGKGVFAPELSARAESSPGIFSESTLLVQLNTQIARADKGLEIIDARLSEALAPVLREGETLLALRRTLATITAALAIATEPGEIAALTAQITSTNTLINTSITKISSAKAEFASAESNKENIAKARADLLALRKRLLSTTKIEDVEVIATDAINLTNALDIFFEIAAIAVPPGLTGTADVKISTIEQIDRTTALAGRAGLLITTFTTGATRINAAILTSQIPVLDAKKIELASITSSLATLRATINAATAKETVRTTSITTTNSNISATAKIFEINQVIASAARDFNP